MRYDRWMRRGAASALAVLALTAACAGNPEVYEVPPGSAAEGLPEPVPAVPAFVVKWDRPITEADLDLLRSITGTAAVSSVTIQPVRAEGSGGSTPLLAAAVDPLGFRPVAPVATRDADFVWQALLAGDAVITHEGSEKLGRKGSKKLVIRGIGTLPVGAVAENATPNLADVLLDAEAVPAGRLRPPKVAVIGAATGVTLQVFGRELRRRVDDAEVHRFQAGKESEEPEQENVAPGLPSTSVTGLHPVLAESLHRLLQAGAGRISLVSGFRTPERQYQLWLGALAKYGDPEIADNWVAPPGHSFHERGLAVDLGGDLNLAVQLIGELGLPMYRPMPWEPWHFELAGSRG